MGRLSAGLIVLVLVLLLAESPAAAFLVGRAPPRQQARLRVLMTMGAAGTGKGSSVLERPTAAAVDGPSSSKAGEQQEEGDEDARVAAFLRWLRENGARFDRIRWPAYDTASGSRGAVATVDIAPGDPLLELPERLLLSPTAALDAPAPLGPALEACMDSLTDEEALAAFLCHELSLGPDSFYHPYLAILPPAGDLGALSCVAWADAEIEACQDPWLVAEVGRRRRGIREGYARVVEGVLRARHPEVFGTAAFAFERWEYATLLVQSRAFGRRLDFPSLVPLADLLNHANVQVMYSLDAASSAQQPPPLPPATSQQQERVFRLYYPTGSDGATGVRAGAEVFNSYGRRGNAHFLLHYGFALSDNEWEAVALPPLPPIAKGSPAQQAAILALGERAGEVLSGTHVLAASAFNWGLLWYARTLAAAQEPPQQQQQRQGRMDLTRPLSRAQEAAALRWLRVVLAGALAAFPTTVGVDEVALRSLEEGGGGSACYRLRAAITYRLTRKRVLRRHLRAVDVLVGVVEGGREADIWGELFIGAWEEDGQLNEWVEALDVEPVSV